MLKTPRMLLAAPLLTLALTAPAATAVPLADAADAVSVRTSDAPVAEKPKQKRNGYGLRLTTFNVLTSSIRPGGVDRAHRAARWVQGERAHVAAFQEVAKDQLRTMQRTMPGYNFYPRRTLGTRGSAIQLAWRTSEVKKLKTGVIYRPFLRHQRPIPYGQFQHRKTNRKFWVVAIHNSPGRHQAERDISVRKQIKLVKRLLRTDKPVFVVGDVNERVKFCTQVARATPLVSMNGGTRRKPCPVPRNGGPDWMMGTGASFSNFAKVYNGISDHPALRANAWVKSNR